MQLRNGTMFGGGKVELSSGVDVESKYLTMKSHAFRCVLHNVSFCRFSHVWWLQRRGRGCADGLMSRQVANGTGLVSWGV